MKYIACTDKYKAMGWVHAQAILQGQGRNLYPAGFLMFEDGSVGIPDEAVDTIRLRAGETVSDTASDALNNRFIRARGGQP